MPNPRVLYEDNHLLVLDKPAGMPTAGVTDRPSVYQWVGSYLKEKYAKPGNVYVGIVSRLDTVTSGVLVVAKTSKAAGRLAEQMRLDQIRKTYLAVVEGTPQPESGQLVDWVYKEDDARRMRVVKKSQAMNRDSHGSNVQKAVLEYQVLARGTIAERRIAMLRIELITGRKHQIRVQFSSRGWPVWGDHKYGQTGEFPYETIALHAWQLRFEHPTRHEPLNFVVAPPTPWTGLFSPETIPDSP